MRQITLRVSESVKDSLQGEAEDNNQTLSDYMRDLISRRNEDTVPQEEFDRLQRKYEKLQAEHDRLRTEVERVREEKRQILAQRSENQQLRRYVEVEREHAEKTRQANLPTRLKWLLFGDQD